MSRNLETQIRLLRIDLEIEWMNKLPVLSAEAYRLLNYFRVMAYMILLYEQLQNHFRCLAGAQKRRNNYWMTWMGWNLFAFQMVLTLNKPSQTCRQKDGGEFLTTLEVTDHTLSLLLYLVIQVVAVHPTHLSTELFTPIRLVLGVCIKLVWQSVQFLPS